MAPGQPESFDLPFTDLPPAQPPNVVKFPANSATAASAAQALEIYNLYPRKCSRPDAIRAIQKAIAVHDFEFVKERTAKYAEVRRHTKNEVPQVPYPATWFNAERFLDDEEEWQPWGAAQATPAKKAELAQAQARMPSDEAPEGWEEFLTKYDGGVYATYKGTYRHSQAFMKSDFANWRKANAKRS